MDSTLLTLQNPWWENNAWQKMDPHLSMVWGKPYYYHHPWVENLEFQAGQVHILRGPRQVGKTTLLKEWVNRLVTQHPKTPAENILMLSCEGMKDFEELQAVLLKWLTQKRNLRTYVFLDEVTFVEQWQRVILSCFNIGLTQQTTLVITGSNARDLKKSSERLPGRRSKGRDLALSPLMPYQYLQLPCFQNQDIKNLTDIYLKVGGFPHAIRDFVTLGYVSEETFRTYRNWIIGDAVHYELSEEILKHILFRIYETSTTRITWSSIIENTTVKSHETALNYIEHLQDAHLCELLYCFNPEKKIPAIHKARKIYFIDPLIYYLAASWKKNIAPIWQWIQLSETFEQLKSHLLESVFVVQARLMQPSTYYWYSTKTKQEVDLLIITQGEKMNLYEIKWENVNEFKVLSNKVNILTHHDLFSQPFRTTSHFN